MENTKECECNEIKIKLIKDIINLDCNDFLSEKRDWHSIKTRIPKLPHNYSKKMSDMYKILYDSGSKPSILSKVFRIKADQLNYNNGLIIHLAVIKDEFEIIFENSNKLCFIENEDKLTEATNFKDYVDSYNTGIGSDTDTLLENFTFSKHKDNTREINIPYAGNFTEETINKDTYIEFYPTVSINFNLRFSLMMRFVDKNSDGIIPEDPDFVNDYYYDDFCLKPPGC